MNDTLARVKKSISILVLDHPFFGALALRQTIVIDDKGEICQTAATDGKRLIFYPPFVDKLTDHELLFLVAHEVMHSVFDHMFRRHGRDHMLWNIAGDYVINRHLIQERIGRMPKGGLDDHELFRRGNGSSDTIYALLADDAKGKPQPKPGQQGGALDDIIDGGDNPAEIAKAEAENKVAVAQAAQAAKMMGSLSKGLAELVGELLNPKVPWAEVLRDFVVKCKNEERTYARPARRFAPMGIYAPSRDGTKMGRIVLAIDRSGSQLRELEQFASEINAIIEDVRPELTYVIYFDSRVTGTEEFLPDEPVILHPSGGGGTRFSPIFEHIDNHDDQPVCCVVLTDLECNDYGPCPDYPVLWVTTKKGKAPWGQVLEMY